MSEPPREELEERVAELERIIEELRDELRPRRGPFGLPRPPSPGEFLQFTDEYAIPAALAILEANVRTLELLQRVIRATEPTRSADASVRERTVEASRETLDRLDRTLAEFQDAIEEGSLPRDGEARRLLREARELNAEISSWIGEADAGSGDRRAEEVDEDESGVEIDVESELQSIREELDESGSDDGESGESEDGDTEGRDGESGE